MADPLSIISATISFADVCFRLVNYLRDVQADSQTIDEDISTLIHEIKAINAVNQSIRNAFPVDLATFPSSELLSEPERAANGLWMNTEDSLRNCQNTVQRLETIVKGIYGETGPSAVNLLDQFVKASRKRSKEKDLRHCRDQLSMYQRGLLILLTAINLYISVYSSLQHYEPNPW
jgi:hypothetical protein